MDLVHRGHREIIGVHREEIYLKLMMKFKKEMFQGSRIKISYLPDYKCNFTNQKLFYHLYRSTPMFILLRKVNNPENVYLQQKS